MLTRQELSLSLAGLADEAGRAWSGPPRRRVEWAAQAGYRWVQLDAAAAGFRPRDLDRSARRDLAAMMRRGGLGLSGLDLFIPPGHFSNPAQVDRAVAAVSAACELADELSRLGGVDARRIALSLPHDAAERTVAAMREAAGGFGVRVIDHAWPGVAAPPAIDLGVDPARMILGGLDPTEAVASMAVAPAQARLSDASRESGLRVPVGDSLGRLVALTYSAVLATRGLDGPVVVDVRALADQAEAAARGQGVVVELTRPRRDCYSRPMSEAQPIAKPEIPFDEFAKVDLRVAKILSCEPHPSADRLYKLKLDDGSGTPRQICAGIREHYTPEELVGQSIIIVANLAPRMLRGEESRGMLLAASDAPKTADPNAKRRVVILTSKSEIPPGSIVS